MIITAIAVLLLLLSLVLLMHILNYHYSYSYDSQSSSHYEEGPLNRCLKLKRTRPGLDLAIDSPAL